MAILTGRPAPPKTMLERCERTSPKNSDETKPRLPVGVATADPKASSHAGSFDPRPFGLVVIMGENLLLGGRIAVLLWGSPGVAVRWATSFWAALCMGLPYALADALLLERLRGVSAGAHVFSACSASQARMSATSQPVTFGPSLRGAGNVPALIQRHTVEAEAGTMGVGLPGFLTSCDSRR